MGGGTGGGGFGNTYGSKTTYESHTKQKALKSVNNIPEKFRRSVKSFFKGSSNSYNHYSITEMPDGSYHITMEKPGNVSGSKAIYHKIINKDGRTIKVYKDTFDPKGNLVHRKDK